MRRAFQCGVWLAVLICAGTSGRAGQAADLKVMTFNIWVGGNASGQPLSQTAAVIEAGGADLIGLQEQSGSTAALADMLGFYHHVQNGDISYLSRYPITDVLPHGIEVEIGLGTFAHLFNIHYAPYPYGPYDLRDNPNLTGAQLIATADATRGPANRAVLAEMEPFLDAGTPAFLLGDFNEPSHLDWTAEAANAGLHFGRSVQWPTSLAAVNAGLIDSYRAIRPDEVGDPAETWTPGYPAPNVSADEVHDRIDIIYHAGNDLAVTDVAIVGESAAHADIVVTPYPSDHRAVVATYDIPIEFPLPILGDVNLDGRVDQLDADIIQGNWLREFAAAGVDSYLAGDLSRDAVVNLNDVAVYQRGLQQFSGRGPTANPEPAAALLLWSAFFAMLQLRRMLAHASGAVVDDKLT
jgi:endonuclease/exonuclease/phosphatase family metal-dependent hydrolase